MSCRATLVAAIALGAAACGSNRPTAPSAGGLQAPRFFRIVSQRVTLASNEIILNWLGTAPGYRLAIGSRSLAGDVLTTDVVVPPYTFVAPRTAHTYYARVMAVDGGDASAVSQEITISAIDLRPSSTRCSSPRGRCRKGARSNSGARCLRVAGWHAPASTGGEHWRRARPLRNAGGD